MPGVAPVASPSSTMARAVDEHPLDADRAGGEARGVAGQVGDQVAVLGADGRGVEHDDVGDRALAEHAAVAQAEQRGRRAGSSAAPPARAAPACGRGCSRRGTGWGRARRTCGRGGRRRRSRRSSPGVVPHLARAAPTTSPSSSWGIGHSTVRRSSAMHDVEQRVEGLDWPRSAAMSRDHAVAQPLVLGGVGVADDVVGPVGEAAEHAGLLATATVSSSRRRVSGSLQPRDALGHVGTPRIVAATRAAARGRRR